MPRKIHEPSPVAFASRGTENKYGLVAVAPLPDGDQLRRALIDGAKVLARSTLAQMPALGRVEMQRMLERRGAQRAVVVNVGSGTAKLVAAADGEKPLRAALR